MPGKETLAFQRKCRNGYLELRIKRFPHLPHKRHPGGVDFYTDRRPISRRYFLITGIGGHELRLSGHHTLSMERPVFSNGRPSWVGDCR